MADALDMHQDSHQYEQPSADGHFGQFGGRFVAETLWATIPCYLQAKEKWWNLLIEPPTETCLRWVLYRQPHGRVGVRLDCMVCEMF